MGGNSNISELDTLYKDVVLKYMYLVISIQVVLASFYWYEKIFPYNYLLITSSIIHFLFLFMAFRLDYHSIKLLIPIYLVTVSICLYPIVLFLWGINQVTAFMWFLIFPVGVMVFFETKTVIFWTIYILIEALSIFILSDVIDYRIDIQLSNNQLSAISILTICSCLILISFFIYYLNKTNQAKITILQSVDNSPNGKEEHTDTEKFHELYYKILNYFDNKKPYCDSDFSINQLADAMDSNITYISKAINTKEGMNFNLFVNTYRINMVKSMLSDDYQNRYTIKYIYTSSGFKHQSTFNKVFKQIEGITPSEYIRKINKSKAGFSTGENEDTDLL